MNLVDNNIFLNGYGSLEKVIYHLKNNLKTKIAVSTIHGIGIIGDSG
jgi:hypothetical protein